MGERFPPPRANDRKRPSRVFFEILSPAPQVPSFPNLQNLASREVEHGADAGVGVFWVDYEPVRFKQQLSIASVGNWKRKIESATYSQCTYYPNFSAMSFHDAFGNI